MDKTAEQAVNMFISPDPTDHFNRQVYGDSSDLAGPSR